MTASAPTPASADLRTLSTRELVELGERSLREHLLAQAVVAHHKHGRVLSGCDAGRSAQEGLDQLLEDRDCVRYPIRLVYEFGEMAMHQFAQPDVDWRDPEQNGKVLYLRPLLRSRPDLVVLAVAYMLPVINYGDIINDSHCLSFGAALLGMMEDEFYQRICELADFVGAESCASTVAACHS